MSWSIAYKPQSVADAAEADWQARAATSGIVLAQDFRGATSVSDYVHPNTDGVAGLVTRDTSNFITGAACKIRTITALPTPENGAAWRAPMNSSWTTNGQGFGGTKYYITFQVYHAPNRLTCGSDGGGFKILNLAEYNFTNPENSRSHPQNGTGCEIVLSTKANEANIPIAYRDPGQDGFFTAFGGGGNQLRQPAVDNGNALPNDQRYCLWTGSGDTFAGCVKWPVGEWFEVRLEIQVQSPDGTAGNTFRYAIKKFGLPEMLMYNMSNFLIGADDGLPNGPNGIWFQTFNTGQTSIAQDTYTLYNQLLIGTSPIAARAA